MVYSDEGRERNKAVSSYYNQHSIDVAAAKVLRGYFQCLYSLVGFKSVVNSPKENYFVNVFESCIN
jgi:hypothetical protein